MSNLTQYSIGASLVRRWEARLPLLQPYLKVLEDRGIRQPLVYHNFLPNLNLIISTIAKLHLTENINK